MKIIKAETNVLVIIDNSVAIRLLGIFFIVFGILMAKPELIHSNNQASVGMAIIFIGLGLLSLILPSKDTVVFDKNRNIFSVEFNHIFFKRKNTYELLKVSGLKMLTILGDTTPESPSPKYRIACTMGDNKEVILNPIKSSFSATYLLGKNDTTVPARTIAKQISEFLNVPYEELIRSKYDDPFYKQHPTPFNTSH